MFRKSYINSSGRRGRRPLHLFNRINFQNYKALLIYNLRNVCVSQAWCATQGCLLLQNVSYIAVICFMFRKSYINSSGRRGRRPLHLFNRINFQNYKALLIDNSRDVCTSQARCATQGRRLLQNELYI